ncbi:MAG TPA: SDR family oxidoreductase, partial [Armatimonadota bacterium]
MAKWTADDIPPQTLRRAVVTGATGGLGYETALALARKGAHVILAGRSETKGANAAQQIAAQAVGAAVRFEKVDLADLGSVAAFAGRLLDERQPIDLLINNAGVMTPPTRYTTADGFELQFGTNYLSHFALTARLLPLLDPGRKPRVVSLSSGAHRLGGAIHFDDLQWERSYKPWLAYAQSKLAMLMFALELQRRSDENGWGLISNAAHPGWAMTGLQTSGPRMGRENRPSFAERLGTVAGPLFAQSAATGALPTLFAATSAEATGAA